MKAFLSHNSDDKEFVLTVAAELGRQFCVVDEYSFAPGIKFRASIEAGLTESSLFVLFFSRSARDSGWVDFEVDEAWYRSQLGHLRRAVVYLIDTAVTHDDLPLWLRRARVQRHNAPRVVARDIRHQLNGLLLEPQRSIFVGRTDERRALEEALLPVPGRPPRAVFVTGLPQIGRRSLVRDAAPSLLNLQKLVEIPIRDGDSVNDIAVRVADGVEPYNTPAAFARIVTEIEGLPPDEAVQRTLGNLRRMVELGELPVFLDEGGMLDADGHIGPAVRSVVAGLSPTDTAYLILISKRRPQTDQLGVPVVAVGSLKREDIRRLLVLLSERVGLTLKPDQSSVITEAVAGHPPTAYHAIQLAKRYGPDLVASDDAQLVQYRTSALLHHLNTLTLRAPDKDVLRILDTYSPLPRQVLSQVAGLRATDLNDSLIRLIDLALVIPTDDGFYRLAEPVAGAVEEVCEPAEDRHHVAMQDALDDYLRTAEAGERRMELNRLRFLANKLADNDADDSALIRLVSDSIEAAESLYHREQFEKATTLARAAVGQRPDSEKARTVLIKGLIKQGHWSEAENELQELDRYARRRNVAFLRGFLERHRQNLPAAVDAYLESRTAGRNDVALRRELAHCYFVLNELEAADTEIRKVVEMDPRNDFAFDLWAQIACRRRDEPAAREALRLMEKVIGRTPYYLNRLSVVEVQFGTLENALSAAREATKDVNPPLGSLVQLVYCLTRVGQLAEAESTLSRLNVRARGALRDARIGVQCHLAIARKQYAVALRQSDQLSAKNSLNYRVIRRDAIMGELNTAALPDTRRASLAAELARHLHDLQAMSSAAVDPLELMNR